MSLLILHHMRKIICNPIKTVANKKGDNSFKNDPIKLYMTISTRMQSFEEFQYIYFVVVGFAHAYYAHMYVTGFLHKYIPMI